MRTLQIAMYALAALALGCGSVGEVTSTGEKGLNGCLSHQEDVNGIAMRNQPGVSIPGCPGIPDSIEIVAGKYMDQAPAEFYSSNDGTVGSGCQYEFGFTFPGSGNCTVVYTIR